MRRRVLLFAPAFLLLAGCDFEDLGSSDRYTADFHYSYPLKPGGRLSVEDFNGSIEISSWEQDSVDISGTKYAATLDLVGEKSANFRLDGELVDPAHRAAVGAPGKPGRQISHQSSA